MSLDLSHESVRAAIRRLAHGETLGADEIAAAFDAIMRGEATVAQIAALLMALRVKGETSVEVAGVASALRRAMVPLTVEDADAVVDTCGTGGGRVTTFNISTAAALVAAGAGVRVAKHGNRSFTSRSGSADVLEALGVAIDVSPDRMAEALVRAGITFMFAPLMHPAMKHVGPVRRELAVPTVMNIVGPLANPARVGRQVVGVADRQRLPLIAGALQALGAVRAMVVYGEPGMDEISPLGVTTVLEVRAGEPLSEWHIDPGAYGIAPAQLREEELAGGDPSDNAAVIEEVLRGEGAPTATLAVELNAAAAIYVADRTATFTDAVAAARESLRSGAALHRLERLREVLGQGRA